MSDKTVLAYIALGANLALTSESTPLDTLEQATQMLAGRAGSVIARSGWYESPPWPPGQLDHQPPYYNGAVAVRTSCTAAELLALMHGVEADFGRDRVREGMNGARTLDLDLIAVEDEVWQGNIVVPHPRMHLRRFVLEPLAAFASEWQHPILGKSVAQLLAELPETEPAIQPVGQSEKEPGKEQG